jgi:glycosyltransferase involved in cell wall biosynthesis
MKIAICVPTHNELEERITYVMSRINDTVGPGHVISKVNDKDSMGKGWALREAVKAVEADYYIFLDGDGDIDPVYLAPIAFYLNQGWDIVVGKKELPKTFKRKIITFFSRLWIKMLFGLKVDTQTGIKGFRYKPDWHLNGWAFDIEILSKARKAGKSMIEIPIHATVSSGKSWHDIASTLRDTIKLRIGI